MFCPTCGSEYRPGFERCAECDVQLVDTLPVAEAVRTVIVFETSDAAVIPVAESILRAAGIQFEERGASLQALFAGGQLGGVNPISGPVAFVVAVDEAPKARKLLARLSRRH